MSETNNPKPSIIAEPTVATYGSVKPAYVPPAQIRPWTIAGVAAPDAVWEFAKKHGLITYLEMGIQ